MRAETELTRPIRRLTGLRVGPLRFAAAAVRRQGPAGSLDPHERKE